MARISLDSFKSYEPTQSDIDLGIDSNSNTSTDSPNTTRYSLDQFYNFKPVESKVGIGYEIRDLGIAGVNAAMGSIEAITDFFSPGNRFGDALGDSREYLENYLTDKEKFQKAKFGYELSNAETLLDEAGVAAKYALENPLMTAAMGIGSFAVPGVAIKGVGAVTKGLATAGKISQSTKKLVDVGIGGGLTNTLMSGGDAAGQAYDMAINLPQEILNQSANYREYLQQGLDANQAREKIATDAARSAQLIPSILGAFVGVTGFERILGAPKQVASGPIKNALKSGLFEGVSEGIEEGTALYQAQKAVKEIDPSIDPMKGVAGAGTLGAFTGFVPGAGAGIYESRQANKLLDNTPDEGTTNPEVKLNDATNVGEAVDAANDIAGSLSDTITNLETSVDNYLASTPNVPEQTPPPVQQQVQPNVVQDQNIDPKVSAERPSRITFDYDRQGSARITPRDVKVAKDIFRDELQAFNNEFEPKQNLDDSIVKTAIASAKDEFFSADMGEGVTKEFETAFTRASTNLNKKLDRVGANQEFKDATYELVGKITDDYSARLRNYDRMNVQERVAGTNPLTEQQQEVVPPTQEPVVQPTEVEQTTIPDVPPVEPVRFSAPRKETVALQQTEFQQTKTPIPGAELTFSDGRKVKVVDQSRLGNNGKFLKQVGRIFGKRLVAFESVVPGEVTEDGFVNPKSDPDSIYLNSQASSINPISVFGHELMHLVKVDNRAAYDAIEKVVNKNVTDEQRQRFGKETGYDQKLVLEEISSDLLGNRFIESDFWTEVFEEIGVTEPEQQQTIISRLAAAIRKALNNLLSILTVDVEGFDTDNYIANITDVKKAIKSSVKDYAKSRRIKAVEFDRAEIQAEKDIKLNERKPENKKLDERFANPQETEEFKYEKFSVTREDKEKAKQYEADNNFRPYLSAGQLSPSVEVIDGTKFSVKREGKYGNHPQLGIPVNKNGTVTVYYHGTNDEIRQIKRNKKLKGHNATTNRIYVTNESEPLNVINKPGNMDQKLGGANVLFNIDPSELHLDKEYPNGRKDFFIPIAEGQAFNRKMKNLKMFALYAPRGRGFVKSTSMKQIEKSVAKSIKEYKAMNPAERSARFKEAKKIIRDEHNIQTLYGENGKLYKTRVNKLGLDWKGKSVWSQGLGLASAQALDTDTKQTTCPDHANCQNICLSDTSGQNQLYGGDGPFRGGPRLSQYLKTEALVMNPEAFAVLLFEQTKKHYNKARSKAGYEWFIPEGKTKKDRIKVPKQEYHPAFRLNVTADIPASVFKPIIDSFPEATFYDYTKLFKQDSREVGDNHHLTYSANGAAQIINGKLVKPNGISNWDRAVQLMLSNKGKNVAMAFSTKKKMPTFVRDEKTGELFDVINGDEYDARFLDPVRSDGRGSIIGLGNKDRLSEESEVATDDPFFFHYDPETDGDTVLVRDQKSLNENLDNLPIALTKQQREQKEKQQVTAESLKKGLVVSSTRLSKERSKFITVYRGGNVNPDSPLIYTTPNIDEAKRYARYAEEKEPILKFRIDSNKIASEEEVRKTLEELGYPQARDILLPTRKKITQSAKLSEDDFLNLASSGQLRQSRDDQESLESLFTDPNVKAQDIEITMENYLEGSPLALDYGSGDLEKRLNDAGFSYKEEGVGSLIVGRTKKDVDFLEKALDSREKKVGSQYALGKMYGYSEADIAAFYKKRYSDAGKPGSKYFIRDKKKFEQEYKDPDSEPRPVENNEESKEYIGGMIHEYLDPNFKSDGYYLGDGVAAKLKKSLESKGFEAYEAEGTSGDGSKRSVQEIILLDVNKKQTDEFGFYSNALEVLNGLQQNKGTGEQFRKQLENNGVKKAEMRWLGLDELLIKPKVTKEELTNQINLNRIKLREVVSLAMTAEDDKTGLEFKSTDDFLEYEESKKLFPDEIGRYEQIKRELDSEGRTPLIEDNPIERFVEEKTGMAIVGSDDVGYLIFKSVEETNDRNNAYATSSGKKLKDIIAQGSGDVDPAEGPLDDVYSLNEATVQAQRIAEQTELDLGFFKNQSDVRWEKYVEGNYDGSRVPPKNYRELRFQLDVDETLFNENVHFFKDKNNLFHTRLTDRKHNDDKVLYVEELQSDWAQMGRSRGFKKQDPQERADQIQEKIKEKAKLLKTAMERIQIDPMLNDTGPYTINDLEFEQGETFQERILKYIKRRHGSNERNLLVEKRYEEVDDNVWNDISEQLVVEGSGEYYIDVDGDFVDLNSVNAKDFYESYTKFFNLLGALSSNIKEAPFVTSTDQWTQLAIKRLLQIAVDEEYDTLAFSPGVVQENRWRKPALRKYYDEILPKNIKKVVNKVDPDAVTTIDAQESNLPGEMMERGQPLGNYTVQIPTRMAINITPKIKDFVSDGMPMFSRARRLPQEATRNVPVSIQGEQPQTWTEPDQRFFDEKLDKVRFLLQDKYIDLDRITREIKKEGQEIKDRWNPYRLEQTYHGRSAEQNEQFVLNELYPLIESLRQNKLTIADLEEYAHNLHATERNKQIAKINEGMPDGGSGIKSADAAQYFLNLDANKKEKLGKAHSRLMSITKKTRQLLVDSGLETQETIDNWETTYKNYVPLQRGDLDFVDPSGSGEGRGFAVKGPTSKRAKGSEKDVIDIMANISMQRERAIVRAEKTRVARALFNLSVKAPNPKFWLAIDPNLQTQEDVQKSLDQLGLQPEDARGLFQNPQEKVIDSQTGLVRDQKITLSKEAYAFPIRVDGKERYLLFNANNERAKRLADTFMNMDTESLSWLSIMMGKVSRYIANINTQYNPVFGAVNLTRDVQGMAIQLSTTPIAGQRLKVTSKLMRSAKAVYRYERSKYLRKPLDREKLSAEDKKFQRFYDEFRQAGGKTGYRDQYENANERGKALEEELMRQSRNPAIKVRDASLDWLSSYNDALENATRLSVYMTARENNLSKDESAMIAKNITTNFNKKGSKTATANSWYAFFNAAVQGSTRLGQTMFERTDAGEYKVSKTGRNVLIGGLSLGAFQHFLLYIAGFEEDDIPRFIKEKNLIIPTFGLVGNEKNYAMIPMPLGYNFFPNVSRHAAELLTEDKFEPQRHLFEVFESALDVFNPIGGSTFSQTLAPTPVDWLVGLKTNEDFSGRPIFREDFNSLKPTPGYTRARDTASGINKAISKFLNWASGGTEYTPGFISPTPDQLDYLVGQAFGGIGRELTKIQITAQSMFTGEELPSYKVPLGGRFFGSASGKSGVAAKYYQNLEKIYKASGEVKGREEDGKPFSDFLRENPEANLEKYANKMHRRIGKLKKERRELVEEGGNRDSVKRIEEEIAELMTEVNSEYRRERQKAVK